LALPPFEISRFLLATTRPCRIVRAFLTEEQKIVKKVMRQRNAAQKK
jgi:hypothetical protein